MRLTIGQTAQITGVSIRTLRYYDQIGLVKPAEITQSGYRYYDEKALRTLLSVLFYRELGLPLEKIACILRRPEKHTRQALGEQRALLERKRARIDEQLKLLACVTGGENMHPQTTIKDIRHAREAYGQEAQARYGQSGEWKESQAHAYTDEEALHIANEMDALLSAFAHNRHMPPQGEQAFALAKRWQDFLTQRYFHCTLDILASLAQLYVGDERFRQNIDRFGEGTAQFMHDALCAYVQAQRG